MHLILILSAKSFKPNFNLKPTRRGIRKLKTTLIINEQCYKKALKQKGEKTSMDFSPPAPYPMLGGIVNFLFPPTFIPASPTSQP